MTFHVKTALDSIHGAATCKFDTNSNTPYGTKTLAFDTETTDSTGTVTVHTKTISSGLSNGLSQTYFVRCQSADGSLSNQWDFPVSFSIPSSQPAPVTLTINKAGVGSVSMNGSVICDINSSTCTPSVPEGTVITLTAQAGTNYTFEGFSGAGCSGTGSCTITLNAATNVTAVFEETSLIGNGPRTWYVDCNASWGSQAIGDSWADAFKNFAPVSADVNVVQPGDTVEISGDPLHGGCDYGGDATYGLYLVAGTSPQNVTTYKASHVTSDSSGIPHNGEIRYHGEIIIKQYTLLDGSKYDNYENQIKNTFDVDNVVNNTNFLVDVSANINNGIPILTESWPLTIKWMHLRGVGFNAVSNVSAIEDHDPGSKEELAYLWIEQGTFDIGIVPALSRGSVNIHHSLIENTWSKILMSGGGFDFHNNIIRNRQGPYGGCNDTFFFGGDTAYTRIYDNIIEPMDNTLLYLWGNVANIHDFYFYNNISNRSGLSMPSKTMRPGLPSWRRMQRYRVMT